MTTARYDCALFKLQSQPSSTTGPQRRYEGRRQADATSQYDQNDVYGEEGGNALGEGGGGRGEGPRAEYRYECYETQQAKSTHVRWCVWQ